MKSIKQLLEAKADLADAISLDLTGAGLEEGKDFKFDGDTLFARDMQIAQNIADELVSYHVTISEKPRQSDRFYKILVK